MATVQFTLYAQRLLGTGKTSEAITVLEEGLKEFPEYATAYALLARAYLQLHDVPTAYEVVANAIQRFPYHRGLALLYEQLNNILHAPTDSNIDAARPQDMPTTSDSTIRSQSTQISSEHDVPEGHTQMESQAIAGEENIAATDPTTTHLIPTDIDTSNNDTFVQSTDVLEEGQHIAETEFSSTTADEHTSVIGPIGGGGESPMSPQQGIDAASVPLEESSHYTMRLIETATIDRRAMRMLRSSNIRLVPGLEFAPLRIESTRQKETTHAVEFPPFRPIRGVQTSGTRLRSAIPTTPAALEAELQRRAGGRSETFETKTSLELLAEQLERARIKSPEAPTSSPADTAAETEEPTVVTETMASIYERQGAIEQAIKAYTILARLNPDRRSYFEEKIAQLRAR